jgi:hypothetical protein
MKKLFFLLGIVLLSLGAYAQPNVFGQVYSFAYDSTVDTGDKTFTTGTISTNGNLTIQVLCTQISGTSAGSAYVQESVDGSSWATMTASNSSIQFITNDTLTIATTAVEIWNIPITYGTKYRLYCDGSGSNHTGYTVKMVFKPNNAVQYVGVTTPKAWTSQNATNTETVYFTTGRVTSNSILSLQLKATVVSTTTAGTAYIQESLDGTSWKTLNQTSNGIQGLCNIAGDMHATTAVATLVTTGVYVWHIPVTYAAFYRIVVAQTGTSVTTYAASRLLK